MHFMIPMANGLTEHEANVDTAFENDVIPLHVPKPTVNFKNWFPIHTRVYNSNGFKVEGIKYH